MKNKYLNVAMIAFIGLLWQSCDIQDNKLEKGSSFVRIYDNAVFSQTFYPLDVQQTTDGGYLVLAQYSGNRNTTFLPAYLLKVDEEGEFEWNYTADIDIVNPCSPLMPSDSNSFTFVAMNGSTLEAIQVTASQEPTATGLGVSRPLAANQRGPGVPPSIFSIPQGSPQSFYNDVGGQTSSYEIFETVDDRIFQHLTRLEDLPPYPFQVGFTPEGQSYFVGFRQTTLSMIFPGANGIINGDEYTSGINAVLGLGGNKFAISRYKVNGDIVFIPNITIDPRAIGKATEIKGPDLPQLTKRSKVTIKEVIVGNKSVIIYLATKNSNEITLFAYNKDDGKLLGIRNLGGGATNRFEAGSFSTTEDGGLIVLARVFVGDSAFPRLALIKLSSEELKSFTGG